MTGGPARRSFDEDSQPEASAPDTSGVRIPPPLFYVAAFLVGVALELAVPIERPPLAVTLAVVLIGVAAWLALDGAAMVQFSRAGTSMEVFKPSAALVTTGPYRFTRNPMYLGMACLYVSIGLATGVIWALVLLPAVIALVDRLVIAREEPYLGARFGQDYREYQARVRRWL